MVKRTVTIVNTKGVHARPASLLARTSVQFDAKISVIRDDQTVSAKDVLGILSLQAVCGVQLTIAAEGPDEEAAVAEIVNLIQTGFHFD
jgi:phosphocarrier protein